MDKSLKDEADVLMQIPGKARGEVILNRIDYIKNKEGEEAGKKVQDKLAELGHPLDFGSISSLGWYSEAESILIIIVAKDLFGWDDQVIYDMGNHSPKISFIVKLMMNFVSLEYSFHAAPKSWRKHHTAGDLESTEYNEAGKTIYLRLHNFKFHPIYCIYLCGYFAEIARLAIYKGRKGDASAIKVLETKCVFRGDEYDEYKVTW
jgi:hypothetical protein